ncbi:MAG: alkaline phosphatase [Saprospiraceae bacterium]|nr:alkaline phosphatase [Saprospiraceae bacterium]
MTACSDSLVKAKVTENNAIHEIHSQTVPKKPKNVILLIGDGMGMSAISAGIYRSNYKLNFERFPFIGIHKSYSGDNLITDSAAGATAFACGKKTYNSAIGVDLDTMPCKTILEYAEDNGLATGMVVTSTIVHATPAGFIAHRKHRDLYEDIALDFLQDEIDFFIGGGKKYFDRRKDDRNLITELQKKGYDISDYSQQDIMDLKPDLNKNFGYFTNDGDPLPASQGRDYELQATKLALDYLSKKSDKGFFLMIEGSQIDWGGHANNADYIVSEVQDYDKSIGAVLDWAEKDGETLVVLTADHETGGFAINPGSSRDSLVAAFTTTSHTAEMIPVFAFGVGAEQFCGMYENTAIFDKIKALLGF